MPQTACPGCGARIEVPPVGLTMTCAYCAHSAPVPNADKRRARMEREAARQRQAEERRRAKEAKRLAKEQKAQKVQQAQRNVRKVGKLIGLIWTLVVFGIIAIVMKSAGLFEPLIGESGRDAHAALLGDFDANRLATASPAETVGQFAGLTERYVELEAGRCYFLLVGAGSPLKRVSMTDPKDRVIMAQDERSLKVALTRCVDQSGLHKLIVLLEKPGRFTWSLLVDRPPEPVASLKGVVTPADAKPEAASRGDTTLKPPLKPMVIEGALTPIPSASRD